MYSLVFKNFIRSKSVIAALVLFLLAGITSIYIGKQFLKKQQAAVNAVTHQQNEHIKKNTAYIPEDFGLLMYYLKFAYINQPAPIAALSIGQQDVNNSIQSLTIRGLEGQRYDTDLYNPYNLLMGNFDMSFLIIFLLPLLIIAFNFNVLSQEKEAGTWPLVSVQAAKPLNFIFQIMSIRFFTIVALLFVLLTAAKFIVGIPVNSAFIRYSVISLLYILFWFAVSFLIISFKKNTSVNALALLSSWVLFCLLIPAVINNYISSRYTVPEAYSTMVKQRDGYHTKWDKNKDSTMQAFFAYYPEYKNYVWERPGFNYLWYYAMQQLGDNEAAPESKAMQQKLLQRQHASTRAGLFFPSVHTQLQLTSIAGTSLQHHLQYMDGTTTFHESVKKYFYGKIFSGEKVGNENWEQHVPQYFKPATSFLWPTAFLPLLIPIILLFAAGLYIFKKSE
ncbi:MAG: DUF3526 domain-containing protein [Sphingobacteriales bacterium]|nr:MAG: DUF3526 domain-containing protein [Sphingobacteriales bacterium]